LVATVNEFTEKMDFRIVKTGYGIGNRDSEVPNVLRVFLCEEADGLQDVEKEEAMILESNIDDMNPEHFDYLLEKLFSAGASDAWLSPIIMKKSRPATKLSALCKVDLAGKMKEIIFDYSTSIGVREYTVKKSMLRRETVEIETGFGTVRVKQSFFKGKLVRSKPEFEDCKKLAEKNRVNISEIENEVIKTLGLK
jgi:uncharacterized protein (DUF111 family)